MCYASPVMLRGRRFTSVSGRPGTSSGTQTTRPTPSPASQSLLSLLFPPCPERLLRRENLHPRNSPVTALFPLHTQKQGGGGVFLNSELSTLNSLSPLSLTIPALTRRSPVSPIIPAHTQNRGVGVGYLNGNVPKICRRADIRREEESRTHSPRPGRGRRQPRVGHPLTKGAPTAEPASGFQADERPGPSSGRAARPIRRRCQATAAPCPCVRGIPGG